MCRYHLIPLLHVGVLCVGVGGCVTYRPVVVAPKTSLENDLLGQFERLNEDLPLLASPNPGATLPPKRRFVLQALLDQQLAQPEIERLKRQNLVGEGHDGLLHLLVAEVDPPLTQVVDAENNRRLVIMQGVIASDAKLSDDDLPAVRRCYYRYQKDRDSAAMER